jgi:hypothetical protein
MVMIDLSDEKKSLGVISVTRVTDSSLLSREADFDAPKFPQVRHGGTTTAPDRPVLIDLNAPVKKK